MSAGSCDSKEEMAEAEQIADLLQKNSPKQICDNCVAEELRHESRQEIADPT